jgi:hypothetical protein
VYYSIGGRLAVKGKKQLLEEAAAAEADRLKSANSSIYGGEYAA